MTARRKTRLVGTGALVATAFIGGFERLQVVAYRDVVGVPTVLLPGDPWCQNGRPPHQGRVWREAHGQPSGLRGRCVSVRPRCGAGPLHERFVAHVSLAYNIGQGSYCNSMVVRRYNPVDIRGPCDAFLMWNKAGDVMFRGLTRRREAERDLCQRGL